MGNINPEEFLDELAYCIKEEDIVKAKALLQFASDSDIDISVQQQALVQLADAPEVVAFPLLEHLTKVNITNPEIQDAIYYLILEKAYGNTPLVLSYLKQENKKTRMIYIRAAGDLMLVETAPILKDFISSSKDIDIVLQSVKSLGALRLRDSLPVLSDAAAHGDKAVRHAALFAMADLADNAAVDALQAAVTGTGETDLMAIEAMAGIQNQYALESLTSLLSSHHTHVRDAAIDQLIEIGNKSVPILSRAAYNAESDYMIHLVTTLGYIGDQAAIPVILDLINLKPADANIRQALYESLERIPSPKSAISLAIGLQDPIEPVRMSAARAIDKNLSKVLIAGLKNLFKEKSVGSTRAVAALIDSGADAVLNFIIDEASFLTIAEEHLTTKADPETRARFLSLLKAKNKTELVRQIESSQPDTSGPVAATGRGQRIYVVDDSKMMLKLYYNKLKKLGYEPTAFQFPEEAISTINTDKPDLVITDLNMPKINGIQLTVEIRKKFNRHDLPIMMITTQSDFIEMDANETLARVNETYLNKTGINKVLHKPFTDEALKEAIALFLK